jgi:hypothetical protein
LVGQNIAGLDFMIVLLLTEIIGNLFKLMLFNDLLKIFISYFFALQLGQLELETLNLRIFRSFF